MSECSKLLLQLFFVSFLITIKSKLNKLSAACYKAFDVEKTITGLLFYWRKLKNMKIHVLEL